jgi:UBX domain-containing protein 1/4
MKSTQEVQHLKEELAKKEQIKEAAAKRQEKIADIAAKKRIQEKIAADKEERRLKAERIKAEREGRTVLPEPAAAAAAPAANKLNAAHTEARLRLQTSSGNLQKIFPAEMTLFEVAQALEAESGVPVQNFTLTYPKKVFEGSVDFGKTLKEAGLVPSAVLIVK